jgi:hypothetical protein
MMRVVSRRSSDFVVWIFCVGLVVDGCCCVVCCKLLRYYYHAQQSTKKYWLVGCVGFECLVCCTWPLQWHGRSCGATTIMPGSRLRGTSLDETDPWDWDWATGSLSVRFKIK